jgi:predicted dehydrogenase
MRPGFDLIGRAGAIRFSWERANEVLLLQGDPHDPANGFRRVLVGGAQPDTDRFVAVAGQGLGYRDTFTIGLGRALAAVASGGRDPGPSFAEGLRVGRVIHAAQASSERDQWVAV